MLIHSHVVWRVILTHKVGKTDLVDLVYDEGALVSLCTQDYKCLGAGIMICATVVYRQCDF